MQKDMRSLVFVYDEAGLFCCKAQQQRATRKARIAVPVCLALIFLLSILTPETGRVQGYGNDGIPTFVESDAAFVLCSSPTVTIECPIQPGDLPLVEQACFFRTLTVSSDLHRGPPLSSPS